MSVLKKVFRWFEFGVALAIVIVLPGNLLHGHFGIGEWIVGWTMFALCVTFLRDSAEKWLKRVIKETGRE